MNAITPTTSQMKKTVFSKSKNILPDVIPIQPYSHSIISPSVVKKMIKAPSKEPELIFKGFLTKPNNICKNGDCQNIDIKDAELGPGYCSTKCVVDHSSTLFNEWVFNRNYKATPKHVSSSRNILESVTPEINIINNIQSEKKLIKNDYVIVKEAREPLFNILIDQYSNKNNNHSQHQNKGNKSPMKKESKLPRKKESKSFQKKECKSSQKKECKSSQEEECKSSRNEERDSSPDIIFISHTNPTKKNRNAPSQTSSGNFTPTENKEPITIVIDD